MRILHVIAQYPDFSGSGVYCRNVIAALDRAGLDEQALLYARNPEQAEKSFGEGNIKTYPLLFDTPELPFPLCGMSDIMPYRSSVYSKMRPEMLASWQEAFRGTLARAVLEFRPDLILCHHLFLLARLCLETGLPVFGICHGTDLRQAEQHPDFYRRHVGSLSSLEKVFALSHDRLEEIQQLAQVSGDKILVTGGAYDSEIFYPPERDGAQDSALRLLYAGKICDAKGCFEMLEAFLSLPKSENLTLDMAGLVEKDEQKRLDALLEGEDRVRLLRHESQKALARHMRQCDIFLFPSYYEGLGLIAVEALASGLHLLTTELPGLSEFLGEELWGSPRVKVVPMPELYNSDCILPAARKGHIENLRTALLELCEERRRDPRLSPSFQRQLEALSWDRLALRIRGELQGAVGESSNPE